jgi:hypothetical protein
VLVADGGASKTRSCDCCLEAADSLTLATRCCYQRTVDTVFSSRRRACSFKMKVSAEVLSRLCFSTCEVRTQPDSTHEMTESREVSDALLKLPNYPHGGYLPDINLVASGDCKRVCGQAFTVQVGCCPCSAEACSLCKDGVAIRHGGPKAGRALRKPLTANASLPVDLQRRAGGFGRRRKHHRYLGPEKSISVISAAASDRAVRCHERIVGWADDGESQSQR